MRIIKFIFFINFITMLVLNFIKKPLTIGETWASIHVNSLIGTQKIIESSIIQSLLEVSIWHIIVYPILGLPIYMILSLFSLIIFVLINIKY
jgi:hypothetical protein